MPLLIKRPGEANGAASPLPAETVDIVPTILDVIGAQPPPGLEGLSLFGDEVAGRTTKHISEPEFGTDITFPANQGQTLAAAQRKLALFGGGDYLDPFRLVPPGFGALLGAPAAEAAARGTRVAADIEHAEAYDAVDLDAQTVPALLTGAVPASAAAVPPLLAVVVNGTVAAGTQADPAGPNGSYAFRALLPPTSLRNGRNVIEIYAIQADR